MQEARQDSLREDTLKALQAFQENGLHATFEEVDAWLARLEAGEDAEPPICHW